MIELDPGVEQASTARQEGRYEDALQAIVGLFARVCKNEAFARDNMFMLMFSWRLLAEEHAPAREALARARDAQVRQLLDGDNVFRSGRGYPGTRFQLIAGMNDDLDDPGSTRDLFVHLETAMPEAARGASWTALPAMVAVGDFERARRYLPDPFERLGELNAMARTLPLFPPQNAAPRLAGDLSNMMQDVSLCAATLEGLGQADAAAALRSRALAGLESDELRALAARELDEPGTIHRELSAHRMALEARAGCLHLVQSPPG